MYHSRRYQSMYHPYCPIQWGNTTSEQECWLGDDKVPLPDVDTRNPTVIAQYGDWIQNLVKEYNIDGLRIDGKSYWAHRDLKKLIQKISP